MSAQRLSLDGEWHFRTDADPDGLRAKWYQHPVAAGAWQSVPIPGSWEQHGKDGDEGIGWYRREFELPQPAQPAQYGLCLAGINETARVWLNGVEVHNEGPLPHRFVFRIGDIARPGTNTIAIRVPDRGVPGGMLRGAWLGPCQNIEELLRGEHCLATARPSPDWVRDAVIYEVYPRSFSPEGNFRGIQQQLDRLRNLGVTVLWLMPIYPIGRTRRKGSLGSPYSISDYYVINPELGTLDDFEALVAAVHQRKMRLIIDLVANHTAWDNALMREHPEWFARDDSGHIRPLFADWNDVAQLDYRVPELRRYMTDVMLYWAREVGVDGFRCDVAGLLPTDFWNEARRELDSVAPVMMLAEDDQPGQHVQAFDLTYDWWTYQTLGRMRVGKLKPSSIEAILKDEELDFPAGSLRLRFSGNHDLCAAHLPAMERYGPEGAPVAALLTFALPGVPLIYNGQEAGNQAKLSLFERVPIDWRRAEECELSALYAYLARLRRQRRSLRLGEVRVLPEPGKAGILAVARTWREETTCVLINCTLEPREVEIGDALPTGAVTLLGSTTAGRGVAQRRIELPPLGYWLGAAP